MKSVSKNERSCFLLELERYPKRTFKLENLVTLVEIQRDVYKHCTDRLYMYSYTSVYESFISEDLIKEEQ
jgi:hypothetical protein